MKTISITQSTAIDKITSLVGNITSLRLPSFNVKLFLVLVSVSIFILSLGYVFQVNQRLKQSYLIGKHEKEVEELYQQNKNLEINFAHATALGEVRKAAEELNFEETQTIKYIKVLPGSLVTK